MVANSSATRISAPRMDVRVRAAADVEAGETLMPSRVMGWVLVGMGRVGRVASARCREKGERCSLSQAHVARAGGSRIATPVATC